MEDNSLLSCEDLCVECKEPVHQYMMRCNTRPGCFSVFHAGCAGISPEEYKNFAKHKKRSPDWTCSDCSGTEVSAEGAGDSQTLKCSICLAKIDEEDGAVLCLKCRGLAHAVCNAPNELVRGRPKKQGPEGPKEVEACLKCRNRSVVAPTSEEYRRFNVFLRLVEQKSWGPWIARAERGAQCSLELHQICKSTSVVPVVSKSVSVSMDGSVMIAVHGLPLLGNHNLYADYATLPVESPTNAADLLGRLLSSIRDDFAICPGNIDDDTLSLVYEGLVEVHCYGSKLIYQTTNFGDLSPVDGIEYGPSLRSSECQLLLSLTKRGPMKKRCDRCRWVLHNYKRVMKKEEEEEDFRMSSRMALLRRLRAQAKRLELARNRPAFTQEVRTSIDKDGLPIDAKLEKLLVEVKAVRVKDKRSRRWHPLIIRFCLNLLNKSRAAYLELGNYIPLPSERRLYDYSHYLSYKGGLDHDLLDSIILEYKSLIQVTLSLQSEATPKSEKDVYVGLVLDGMAIKKGLVSDKNSGRINGWIQLPGVEEEIEDMLVAAGEERTVAREIFAIMIRGIGLKYNRIIAAYPAASPTGASIYNMVFGIIEVLTYSGLKPVFITADGASTNAKLYDIAATSITTAGHGYKCVNPYDPASPIFFIYDPVHTTKVLRNNLSNSGANCNTRKLKKNEKSLSWDHMLLVYSHESTSNLQRTALREAHINLTSYTAMKALNKIPLMALGRSVRSELSRGQNVDPSLGEAAGTSDEWREKILEAQPLPVRPSAAKAAAAAKDAPFQPRRFYGKVAAINNCDHKLTVPEAEQMIEDMYKSGRMTKKPLFAAEVHFQSPEECVLFKLGSNSTAEAVLTWRKGQKFHVTGPMPQSKRVCIVSVEENSSYFNHVFFKVDSEKKNQEFITFLRNWF